MSASIQHVGETLVHQAGGRATTVVTLILVILGGFVMQRFQRWADTPPEFLLRMADQRLLAAAGTGDAACVAEALRTGASANACDVGRVSALNLASTVGDEACVRLLVNAGADVAHVSDVET